MMMTVQELIDQLQEGIKDDLTKPDDMILMCSFDEDGEYYHTNNIDFDFTPDRGICEINVRPEPEFIWRCVPNVNYYLEIEAADEDEALMEFESLIGDYQSDLYSQLLDLGFMELGCNWNFAEQTSLGRGFLRPDDFDCYPCIDLSIDIKANTEEEALKKMGDLIKPFMDSFQKKLVDFDFQKIDYPVGFCTDSWKEGEEE